MNGNVLWIPQGWACNTPSNAEIYDLQNWRERKDEVQRILFLNLMPEKVKTESDFVRILSQMPCSIQLLPMKSVDNDIRLRRNHIWKRTILILRIIVMRILIN